MKTANGAAKAYAKQAERIEGLMVQVKAKLASHASRHKADPANYGLVGDLEHYASLLEELLGIEYRTEFDEENREVEVTRRSDGKTIVFTYDELEGAGDRSIAAIALAQGLAESCWG